MNNIALYIVTILIWGTSWIAIAWQIGTVPVTVSVFYRIFLGAILLLTGLKVTGHLRLPETWRFIVLQAICLFSINFVALYSATALIPSGLVSVIFSLASLFNAANARLFYGDRITLRTLCAGVLGVVGLILLFWDSLAVSLNLNTLHGIAWAVSGTLIFSFGNMASRRNSALGITPIQANAWGMGIGAMILLLIVAGSGQEFSLPLERRYLLALLYLAIFASVIAFTTYLVLVARLGPARAGYATVAFPVVALLMSTLFENYEWTVTAIVGIALVLLGNLMTFIAQPGTNTTTLSSKA